MFQTTGCCCGFRIAGRLFTPTRTSLTSKAGDACRPGGDPGANLKSISHRCHPILVAFVWELANETIHLPRGCLQGGRELTSRIANCLFNSAASSFRRKPSTLPPSSPPAAILSTPPLPHSRSPLPASDAEHVGGRNGREQERWARFPAPRRCEPRPGTGTQPAAVWQWKIEDMASSVARHTKRPILLGCENLTSMFRRSFKSHFLKIFRETRAVLFKS